MRHQFLALVVLAVAVPVPAQEVTLRWKHEPGSQLVYRTTIRQDMVMPMGQGSGTTEQVQTMRWTVDGVAANGDATITIATERVQMTMEVPGASMSYDSDAPGDTSNPQAAMLGAMVGTGYTMVIGADGTVKEVRGLEDMLADALGDIAAEERAMAEEMLGEMFSEESITEMMQQSVQVFPTGPIKPSGSWGNEFSVEIPMMGEMATAMTLTLDGVENREGRRVALISSTGAMTFSGAEGMMGGMMEFEDSSITGTLEFDVGRGVVLRSTSDMTMKMNMSAGGEQMSMVSRNRTVIELLEYIAGGG